MPELDIDWDSEKSLLQALNIIKSHLGELRKRQRGDLSR
jgi:hypothetical protein